MPKKDATQNTHKPAITLSGSFRAKSQPRDAQQQKSDDNHNNAHLHTRTHAALLKIIKNAPLAADASAKTAAPLPNASSRKPQASRAASPPLNPATSAAKDEIWETAFKCAALTACAFPLLAPMLLGPIALVAIFFTLLAPDDHDEAAEQLSAARMQEELDDWNRRGEERRLLAMQKNAATRAAASKASPPALSS